jgi:arsenite-transporting ATPase
MRVLLLTGKGGVGKTSLALATALAAAEHGHRCAVISTDAAHSLGDALGREVGPRPVAIADRVTAQEVSPLAELDRSWSEISAWLQAALFDSDSLAAEELLVFPGLEELVALRAVHEVERAGEHDVCVVDCAPTGATLRMLRLPDVLQHLMQNLWQWERRTARVLRPVAETLGAGRLVAPESVFDAFERLYAEIESVRQILLDEDRTSARLVVNPARIVVDETRRSFAYLCLYGVATDAVLVNRVLPEAAARGYFARWAERERAELAEIEKSFPVPQLHAPLQPSEVRGVDALRELGSVVYGARDPAQLFVKRRPVRLARRAGAALLEIDLPNARADEVDVWLRGDDLYVSVRDFERRFALPGSIGGLPIAGTRWRDGVLEVRFASFAQRAEGERSP